MKGIIRVVRWFVCLFLCIWIGTPCVHAVAILSDTQFSELYSVADKPGIAWQWLDSIRQTAIANKYQKLMKYQVDYMEAFIASRQFESEFAIKKLQVMLKEPAISTDPELLLPVYTLFINEYIMLNNYSAALYYIVKSIDLQMEMDNSTYHLINMYVSMANIFADLNLMNQAHERIQICHDLLDKEEAKSQADPGELLMWRLFVYEVDVYLYYNENDYKRMEEIAYLQLELIRSISTEEFEKLFFNEEEADANNLQDLTLAVALIHQGKIEKARSHFQIASNFLKKYPEKLEKSISFLFIDYYIEADSLERATEQIDKYEKSFYSYPDSMNLEYVSFLSLKAHFYAQQNEHEKAMLILRDMNAIKARIFAKMKLEFPLQMDNLSQAIDQDLLLLYQSIHLKHIYIKLLITLAMFLLLFFYFYKLRKNMRSLQEKELKLSVLEKENEMNNLLMNTINNEFQQVKILLKSQTVDTLSVDQELPSYSINTITVPSAKCDFSVLYSRLKQLMSEKQPFLDSNINREKIAQMLSTNKQYLSDVIAQYTGLTFSNYILDFRLSHACNLLLHTSDTIESIASQSGFSSVRTFYRLFKDKMGVSPSQFRTNYKENG